MKSCGFEIDFVDFCTIMILPQDQAKEILWNQWWINITISSTDLPRDPVNRLVIIQGTPSYDRFFLIRLD